MKPVGLCMIIAAFFALQTSIAGADLKVLDRPMWMFPGQQIRIVLEQPEGSGEPDVQVPATLELFDRWDQDSVQRYYFRVLSPGDATLQFSGAAGDLEMPLQVLAWSEAFEPREYENVALPRMWPMDDPGLQRVKTRRTLHSAEDLKRLRENGSPAARAKRWKETSDEDIYHIVPGPCVPRTGGLTLPGLDANRAVGKGCPVCGTEIYKHDAFYPWIFGDINGENAWKVQCPNCKTWFPSNDWRKGDMHSGPFPDDGFGCEPVEPVIAPDGGKWRWGFIAYYHQHRAYMRELTPGILQTAEAYVATGDHTYAHKCAVALLRYAEAMVDMSVNLKHRKRIMRYHGIHNWPVGAPEEDQFTRLSGSFMYIQPNWDTPRMEDCARAWDLIYDAIADDEALLQFARRHNHPEMESIEDFRRFIDAGVMRVTAQAAMDNAVARNFPQQESMCAKMALGLGTEEALDIVDYLLNDVGIRFALSNQYFKDGAGHESPSYNHIQIREIADLFMTLDGMRELHPGEYQPPRFVAPIKDPKFRRQYDFPLEFSLIGRTFPVVGDCGKAGRPDPIPERQGYPCGVNDWKIAYRQAADERFAQCLYGPDGQNLPKIDDAEIKQAAVEAGERLGWQVHVPSNILDGYGHAFLRSGTGPDQRAVWLRYRQMPQHAHSDMLTWGLTGMKRSFLPELGYPEGWTYASHWEKNWGTHYGTKITGLRSWNFNSGRLLTFTDTEPARVAVAESRTPHGDSVALRQRLVALIDVSPDEFYAVTCERVRGGEEHTWSFHGPDGEAEPVGIQPEPYEGTALGEGIEYGDLDAPEDPELSCLALMYDPVRVEPKGLWGLDYELRGQDGLRMRMTSVYPDGGDLRIAKGKVPAGTDRYEMTWAIAQHRGEAPLRRQYLQVVEPYSQERFVKNIHRLPVQGADPDAEFAPLALRVTGEEFVDTIILQPGANAMLNVDGLTFDGEFGFVRQRGEAIDAAVSVRGSWIGAGDVELTADSPEYRGIIRECDRDNWSVIIEPEPPSVEALISSHVSFTNPAGSHASYQIRDAQAVEGGCRLSFNLDPRIGEGFVGECSDNTVTSDTHLRMYRFHYYDGKTIATEDGSVHYRLRDCENGRNCHIDSTYEGAIPADTLREQFVDYDGDGLKRLLIYDYGPGDEVIIESASTLRRGDDRAPGQVAD
ncbi:MAG: hypothetical protein ACLFWB_03705 [Armatimonadota bacterium]